MSRRSVAVFLAAFALVSVGSMREHALARYRRFHAASCSSHNASPQYERPTDATDKTSSGVLYSRSGTATNLLCAVTDSNDFKVEEMSVLRVVLNDANTGMNKYATARWCWTAMGGWTGKCGSQKQTTGAPTPTATPGPETNSTEVLVWDAKTVETPGDAPWNEIRRTGFPYVYVTIPGRLNSSDLSLGVVGYVVSDGAWPEPIPAPVPAPVAPVTP